MLNIPLRDVTSLEISAPIFGAELGCLFLVLLFIAERPYFWCFGADFNMLNPQIPF